VAIATPLDAPLPLLLRCRLYHHAVAMPLPRRHHYRRANACLIVPLSRQRLVVASSPLSPRQCLSCHAGASLVAPPPLSLRHRLSCGASLAPAGCRFANYLDVTPSLLSRRLVPPCYLSLCVAVSLFATSLSAPLSLWVVYPLNPSKKHIGLLGGSNLINSTQRHGTKGLMWGTRGQFLPAAAMVVGGATIKKSNS